MHLVRHDRVASKGQQNSYAKKHSTSWAFVSVFLLILAAGAYWYSSQTVPEPPAPEVAVFKTTAGQRASITLPDGSEAMLNVDSQIRVLSGVTDPVRVVELYGEAYFSVVSDPDRPFIVRAGDAEVSVVGTSFNVLAYPNQAEVQVLVTEGEVRFSKSGEAAGEVTLLKDDFGVLSGTGQPLKSRVADVEKMLAWHRGALVFEQASFGEVARTLERWFDLEIRISDPEIANRHLSTSFEDPTPNRVIAIISSTLSLDYTIQDSTVTFSIPDHQ